jgi:hypothetical protein
VLSWIHPDDRRKIHAGLMRFARRDDSHAMESMERCDYKALNARQQESVTGEYPACSLTTVI